MNNELEKTEHSVIGRNNTTSQSHSSTLTIGMVLDGKYEIKREIARGGMGIVYEAYHKILNIRVAVKIILSDKIDSLQLRRFQKEVLAYVKLSHPNVIKIYDAGSYNNNPYIVMEYIDGVNICQYVAQHDTNYRQPKGQDTELGIPRDWKLCAKLIYKTALALEYIHKQNMLHRDIKPSNILVRSDGTPVIIDLGLVKFQSENNASLTRTGELLGTLQYMPIEQAQGKHHGVDARSDIYSLGLVLYELLTGEMAYSGKNPMEICYKIMSYYPPFPREINPQIPEELDEITMHAIEKKKENRYATAQKFADALKKYLYDNNAQPTQKNMDALYDENIQDTKLDNNDKKRVLLQWNKKQIIEFFILLISYVSILVSTIVIISIIFSNSSTSTNEETNPIPEPPSVSTSPIQPEEETKPPKTEDIDSPKQQTEETKLGKIKEQLPKKRELETELEEIKKQWHNFIEQDWNSLCDKIVKLDSKLEVYEKLEKEQIDLESKIKNTQLKIDKIKKNIKIEEEHLKREKDQVLKDMLNVLEELKNKTTDQREQSCINDIKDTIKNCYDIDNIIISLEKKRQEKKQNCERLSKKIKNIKRYIDKSSNQKDIIKQFQEQKNIMKQFQEQKKQKYNDKKKEETDISIIENIIIQFTPLKVKLESLNTQYIIEIKEKSTLTEKLEKVKNDLLSKRNQYVSLQKERNDLQPKEKQLEDEMNKFEINYENFQKNLQKKSLTKTEIQQLKKQCEELKKQLEKLKTITIEKLPTEQETELQELKEYIDIN